MQIRRFHQYTYECLNYSYQIGCNRSFHLDDIKFQAHSIEQNNRAKKVVTDHLNNKGIQYLDSQSNFIFIKTGIEISDFQPAMEKYGVLVGRPFPPYLKWFRLSMAKPEEMERFTNGLDRVLG